MRLLPFAALQRPLTASSVRLIVLMGALPALVSPATAFAQQPVECVGTRALGMGGAFTAVADDATAVYWNPAGLANGPLVDVAVQRTATSSPLNQDRVPVQGGGWRTSTTFLGFALPSLGVHYLQVRTRLGPSPTAQPPDGRQQQGPQMPVVRSLATDQAGVTLLQSLLDNVVVGTTLKLARGSSATLTTPSGVALSSALDQVGEVSAGGFTRFDLDVGVLAFAGPVRVGLVGRNLRRPDFAPDDATGGGRLPRQVRLGVAVTPGFVVNRTVASQPALTIAFDVDLSRTLLPTGEERHVAAGVERWFGARRVGLRAGVRANTVGDRRPMATAGASVAIRSGMSVEAQFARGRETGGQQWSAGVRVTF